MKRSEHLNVVAGKWLNGYPLSVNGHKYFISGVNSDNSLVLHCPNATDIACDYFDLDIGSSYIFVNDCDHVICEAKRLFVDQQFHDELYVVNKGDIVFKFDDGVPIYYFVDAFTDVSGVFTFLFSYLDSNGKIAHCYSDKGMYRVCEQVAFEHWASRGFKYDKANNTLCPISYELTDKSYVFYCGDKLVSFLANWRIGTYGFAKNKFPFIVPFHKFYPGNIGESLQHNVVKQ